MAPRTQHVDDLLEWVPGSSVAGSVSPISALLWGARRVARAKSLLALLWASQFLIAAGGIAVVLVVLRAPATVGAALGPLLAAAGGAAMEATSLGEAARHAVSSGSSSRRLFLATAWFLLFYGVLAGAVINELRTTRPAPLLARLGAAAGWYAGRFLRLLLLAAALAALLTAAFGAAPATGPAGPREWLLLVLSAMLPATLFDYARVRAVIRDSRSMPLELVRTARFCVRNGPSIILLELLIFALGATAGLTALGVAAVARSLLPAPLAAALAVQFLVLALLWVRLVAWGAMLSLHQGLTLRRLERHRGTTADATSSSRSGAVGSD